MQTPDNNKAIVQQFYREVIGQGNLELADTLISENYIQHSAMLPDGKDALMQALAYMQQMPKAPNPPKPIMRFIAEDDFVVVHTGFRIQGTFHAVLDVFRLEGGKIVEHWDAIEAVADGEDMIKGPTEIKDSISSPDNKALVQDFVEKIMIPKKWDHMDQYISQDFIQHRGEISTGSAGLKNYLASPTLNIQEAHRIIGEGNFVLVQASAKLGDNPYIFYEIFRMDKQKIAEHWSVHQQIPEKLPHNNGMY